MFKTILAFACVLATGTTGLAVGWALGPSTGVVSSGAILSPSISPTVQDASASGGKDSIAPWGQHEVFGAPLLTSVSASTPDHKGSYNVLLLAASDEPGAPRIVLTIGSSYRGEGAVQLSHRATLVSPADPASLAAPIEDEMNTEAGSFRVTAVASKSWLDVSDDREIAILFASASK